ncbi:pyruvate kinase [Micrococcales bacterium 31B]|nr:pyruvate kinase [Micrococcales bacterium 31B]
MRKAKIVCTLGPATETYEHIKALIETGMNIARINMSHGSYAEHEPKFKHIRRAAEELDANVGILVDLQGPKIRLGKFENDEKHELKIGDKITITMEDILGTRERVGTTYKGLAADCKAGDSLLINDGKVRLTVLSVEGSEVHTECVVPGVLSNNKGINLPDAAVSVPALSEKDIADLKWGIGQGADMIALSFVRNAKDMADVVEVMNEVGTRIPVIAKIEKPQAVDALEEIVQAFDGIMVARGDLGVELPLEDVPLVQKAAIELARDKAKPVIVATQMLESMIEAPVPTRAEVSDCANAVLDGADALMLSAETSAGDHPIIAVETMAKIIEYTESNGADRIATFDHVPGSRAGNLTKAAYEIGEALNAKYLVTFTQSGDTARRLSRLRPDIKLLAITPDEKVKHFLALSWGVDVKISPTVEHTDEMFSQVDQILATMPEVETDDLVVISAGSPPGVAGSTNTLRLHRVGDLDGSRAAKFSAEALRAGRKEV